VFLCVSCFLCLCFFFFFQAEDGIRDLIVTGVQTCALPICPALPGPGGARLRGGRAGLSRPLCLGRAVLSLVVPRDARRRRRLRRSEERRVGKEWRSRWSTYE